jgi:hypothetical protein
MRKLKCPIVIKHKLVRLFVLLVLFVSCYETLQAQGWLEIGLGNNALNANSDIWSIAVDDSENVYAAGQFTNGTSSLTGYNYVAKWNGTSWSELGTGSNALNANNRILSIISDDSGNIYAGGYFTNVNGKNYVAKWNGTSWSELGTGSNALNANAYINSIAIDHSGNVYAGGYFTNINGKYYVAKWNGIKWSELGIGTNALNANKEIQSITVDSSMNVYAVGFFTNIKGYPYVSKWNGQNWSELGTGSKSLNANSAIWTIAIDLLGNVYVAGDLIDTNGYWYVAKWSGTNWSELGTGNNALKANAGIWSIELDNSGNVYVAGTFTDGSDYTTGKKYVAKWNGTSWSELGTGSNALNANNEILSIVLDDIGNLYAGGEFTDVNYHTYVAKWNPNEITTNVNNKLNKNDIIIYPNPSTGIINILELPEDVQLNIYNILGQLVSSQNVNMGSSSNIDLRNLPSGVYTLTFNGHNFFYSTAKWVKE